MRFLKVLLMVYFLCLLQGCLLFYFFAPKVTEDELPEPPQLAEFKAVYIAHCGRCHLLIAPSYFRYNATIESVLKRYRKQRIVNQTEAEQIKFYINAVLANEY